jgi:hypothetical protein
VLVHSDGEHCEVEFTDLQGNTTEVATLHQSQVLALRSNRELLVPVSTR